MLALKKEIQRQHGFAHGVNTHTYQHSILYKAGHRNIEKTRKEAFSVIRAYFWMV